MKKRCIGCMMTYRPELCRCPFCKASSDVGFTQPVCDALPRCSIVENLRFGSALSVDKNRITYAGLELGRGKRVVIQEFFAQGYMTRQADGSAAPVDPRYSQLIEQEIERFCRGAKKLVRANGTVYGVRRRWRRHISHKKRDKVSACISLRGTVGGRERQEDAAGFVPCDGGVFAVLCDGMGGFQGGETASAECVRQMMEVSDAACYCPEEVVPHVLRRQAVLADQYIASLRDMSERRLRCGTTLLCAVIRKKHLFFLSAGDSRIYLIHDGSIRQLTEEHNYLTELLRMTELGEIDYEDAVTHPKREALTSYIGMGDIEKLHISPTPLTLTKGDRVLMCSDGLYRCLSDGEILQITSACSSADEAAGALIAAVEEKHLPGQDNATVIVYQG